MSSSVTCQRRNNNPIIDFTILSNTLERSLVHSVFHHPSTHPINTRTPTRTFSPATTATPPLLHDEQSSRTRLYAEQEENAEWKGTLTMRSTYSVIAEMMNRCIQVRVNPSDASDGWRTGRWERREGGLQTEGSLSAALDILLLIFFFFCRLLLPVSRGCFGSMQRRVQAVAFFLLFLFPITLLQTLAMTLLPKVSSKALKPGIVTPLPTGESFKGLTSGVLKEDIIEFQRVFSGG